MYSVLSDYDALKNGITQQIVFFISVGKNSGTSLKTKQTVTNMTEYFSPART